jgi:aryl-alcohol dehydrogenase-like predicted oxidoreductase
MAWLLGKPGVHAPIVGISKLSQLDDAVKAVGLKLSADEVASLEKPYETFWVTGF